MEIRKVEIDSSILKPLEDLIQDFPIPTVREFLEKHGTPMKLSLDFTNRYRYDIEVYRDNQEILEKVIEARNFFIDTEGIDTSNIVIKHSAIAMKFQHGYLEELLNTGR